MSADPPAAPGPSAEELLAIKRLYEEADRQCAEGRFPPPIERPFCEEAKTLAGDLVFLLTHCPDFAFAASRLRAAFSEIAETIVAGEPKANDTRS